MTGEKKLTNPDHLKTRLKSSSLEASPRHRSHSPASTLAHIWNFVATYNSLGLGAAAAYLDGRREGRGGHRDHRWSGGSVWGDRRGSGSGVTGISYEPEGRLISETGSWCVLTWLRCYSRESGSWSPAKGSVVSIIHSADWHVTCSIRLSQAIHVWLFFCGYYCVRLLRLRICIGLVLSYATRTNCRLFVGTAWSEYCGWSLLQRSCLKLDMNGYDQI